MSEKFKLIVQSTEGNQVVLSAERQMGDDVEVRSYTFDPAQAVEVANAIMHAAEDCGVVIQTQTAPIVTDQKRMVLMNRAGLIMNSMKGKPQQRIAMHVVDTILAEIL